MDKRIHHEQILGFKNVTKQGLLLIVNRYNIFNGGTKILENNKKVGRKGTITLSQEF